MQSFGQGTITSIGRNLLQMRKAYILLANPEKSPLYFALGKMDGNFGNMDSTSPFTNSTMWHAFGTLAFGATAGYKKNGFNASLMLIQGGAQFRSANTPVDGTSVPSQLNNLAIDANYTLELGEELPKVKLGASYLKGSAYCQGFPVVHFMPCEDNNPAYTLYTKIQGERFIVNGGFASTTDLWPGTFNPAIPEFEAVKVSSLIIGGSYELNPTGSIKYVLSGEFSDFQSGAQDSPWERQKQWILGISAHVDGNSRLFMELFRVNGYAPLNFISGGNFDDPTETHSRKDANTTGIVIGGVLFL
jgi:hypothetical protein